HPPWSRGTCAVHRVILRVAANVYRLLRERPERRSYPSLASLSAAVARRWPTTRARPCGRRHLHLQPGERATADVPFNHRGAVANAVANPALSVAAGRRGRAT